MESHTCNFTSNFIEGHSLGISGMAAGNTEPLENYWTGGQDSWVAAGQAPQFLLPAGQLHLATCEKSKCEQDGSHGLLSPDLGSDIPSLLLYPTVRSKSLEPATLEEMAFSGHAH